MSDRHRGSSRIELRAGVGSETTITRRSRKGCLACRGNHLKCDEQRPVCFRCFCKNETCNYGTQLTWPDDSRAKGVRHGRQSASSNAITTLNDFEAASSMGGDLYGTQFLNTSAADIEAHMFFAPGSAPEAVARTNSPLLVPRLSIMLHYDETLMSFYDRILCGAATVEDGAKGNPFRALVIPLALQSNAVLNALQAVSAKVVALHQPFYRRPALSYHTGALSGLVGAIDHLAKTDAGLFEACVVCVLLCWFEICCDTNGRWISHLTGLLHLLGRKRDTFVMPPFIVNYLLYHFVVARTVRNLELMENAIKSYVSQATCRTPHSRTSNLIEEEVCSEYPLQTADIKTFLSSESASAITKTLLQWMGSADLHEINTYPGLSSGLLLLMNQIADLEYLSNSYQIAEHNRKTIELKAVLENHQQYASSGLHPTTVLQVRASAETYRLACLLYLHQKVKSIRARIVVRTPALKPLFSEPYIAELVGAIVTQLEDKLYFTRTMANPLWPLFIAACSTNDDNLRLRILALFSQIESDQRYWNVPQVRMMIEKIWRRRDLCVDEPTPALRKYKRTPQPKEIGEFDGGICCDWDRVLQLMANFKWSLT